MTGGRNGQEEDQDVSSVVYWGGKNCLISASWDRNLYVYDDNDCQAREGLLRYPVPGKG